MTTDEPTLSEFLRTSITRVVDEAKSRATDQAELAGMVVGTLVKSGFLLAKQCGASREALEHANRVFLDEVYR